jgi:L-serine kinase (ATP) / ParB family transcriptional regulator, heme-responsive regulator
MKKNTTLPILKIIPSDKLVVHEYHDPSRSKPLVKSISKSGILKNPPMVTPFRDESGRYMVLDGANRISAIKEMNLPHVLAQVTHIKSPNLGLETWNHVIWGMPTEQLFDGLSKIDGLSLVETKDHESTLNELWAYDVLLMVQDPDENTFYARPDDHDPIAKVGMLNSIMQCYMDFASLDRTKSSYINQLIPLYNDLTALIIYPLFSPLEVLNLCTEGYVFPSGITRFSISPRALRVNFPLYELARNSSTEEKNHNLEKWLKQKMENKEVRYYAEPTFLFDE